MQCSEITFMFSQMVWIFHGYNRNSHVTQYHIFWYNETTKIYYHYHHHWHLFWFSTIMKIIHNEIWAIKVSLRSFIMQHKELRSCLLTDLLEWLQPNVTTSNANNSRNTFQVLVFVHIYYIFLFAHKFYIFLLGSKIKVFKPTRSSPLTVFFSKEIIAF